MLGAMFAVNDVLNNLDNMQLMEPLCMSYFQFSI